MTTSSNRAAPVLAAAVRDTVPVAASIVPLALVIGATAAGAGVPVLADVPAAPLPSGVRRLLDHAAPAALAAMVGAGIAGGVALPELASRLPVLLGAAVTAVLAWRGRGIVLPVAAGLAATWVLSVL